MAANGLPLWEETERETQEWRFKIYYSSYMLNILTVQSLVIFCKVSLREKVFSKWYTKAKNHHKRCGSPVTPKCYCLIFKETLNFSKKKIQIHNGQTGK